MAVLFFLFWIVLNGKLTLEIALFGLVISFVITKFTYKRTRTDLAQEKRALRNIYGIIEYLVIVVHEVWLANVGMIQIVLSPSVDELKPTLGYFTTDLKSRLGKVALSSSITLTPGTITVSMMDNEYLIHALDVSMLDGIGESIFVEKLRKMEGK